MKKLTFSKTLYFYDEPQVIELRDAYGGSFVAVLVDDDQYVATGVAPETLRRFREGAVDLRTAMLEFGESEWYLSLGEIDFSKTLEFEVSSEPLSTTEYLPEVGFTLHAVSDADQTLAESQIRNNLVLEISVTPPEAANEHRIRVNTLAGLLFNFQKLVQHAYGAACRELSATAKQKIETNKGHLLDVVVPATEGSFRLLLEAAQSPDMLGQAEVARALTRVDSLFRACETPKSALATMKQNRGHLAASYLRLLAFLDEHKMGLRYSWAEPNLAAAIVNSVSMAQAASIVEVLAGVADLGAEEIILEGELHKADDRGQWRITTETGTFSGSTREGGPSLRGLRIGGHYRFQCLEEIETHEATGREKRNLFLLEHEPVL